MDRSEQTVGLPGEFREEFLYMAEEWTFGSYRDPTVLTIGIMRVNRIIVSCY